MIIHFSILPHFSPKTHTHTRICVIEFHLGCQSKRQILIKLIESNYFFFFFTRCEYFCTWSLYIPKNPIVLQSDSTHICAPNRNEKVNCCYCLVVFILFCCSISKSQRYVVRARSYMDRKVRAHKKNNKKRNSNLNLCSSNVIAFPKNACIIFCCGDDDDLCLVHRVCGTVQYVLFIQFFYERKIQTENRFTKLTKYIDKNVRARTKKWQIKFI